jgi:hypothetical protein
MERLKKIAVALRLLDRDGTVSLTSLLLAGAGAGAVAAPSWPMVGVLLVAAGVYAHKRHLNRSESLRDDTLKKLAEDVAGMAQELTATTSAAKTQHDRLVRVENMTLPRGSR